MPKKAAAKSKPASEFQHKAVAEEIAFLRKNFRDLIATYAMQVEAEITSLHIAIIADAGNGKKLPSSRAHDLRDMLSLLRSLSFKPAKGRRRDMKRIENAVGDVRAIVEAWA